MGDDAAAVKTAEVEVFLAEAGATAGRRGRGRGRRARQHVAALVANLAGVCTGMAVGWPPVAVSCAEAEAACALAEEQAWAGACLPLGALVGAVPAGYLADALGRKKPLLAAALPFVCGWTVALAAGAQVWAFYCSRVLCGVGVGFSCVLVPLYCEEISSDSLRGRLGSFLALGLCLGLLCVAALGATLPYLWCTAVCCLLPVLFLAAFACMPESPVFLAGVGQVDVAKKNLLWLRDASDEQDIQPEFDRMLTFVKDRSDEKVRKSFLIFCSKRPFRSTTARAVAIILGLMFFQQMSGITAVGSYTTTIFEEAGCSLSASMSAVVMAAVEVAATLFSSMSVDRLGRKSLLLVSSIMMAGCLACFSVYSYFNNNGFDVESWRWLPLVVLNVFVIVYALGFGPVPWFMMAELLPMKAKGWGSAMLVSFNWKIALGLTKEFPLMLKYAGQDITYAILSVFCICATIFVALFVPETKGKTKSEIQEALGGDLP